MRQDKELVFREPTDFELGTVYPVIITRDNNDGTFTGKFDFDRMNTVKKIRATQYL